jgi:hypothetical protein
MELLEKNAGLASIAAGWALAIVAIAMSPDVHVPEEAWAPVALMACAMALISFGVGWMFRDEGGVE